MDLTEKYLGETDVFAEKMKDVTIELILQVSPKIDNKSLFRTALKNILSTNTGISLKAIKKISGF